ncbi:MBL fold metallo-hydrolase [Tumebacillus sp. ITR2]|uniref:MBL fold metallo-hydrolase n=1 Tax=Tumebacillus amylolyticus TaxID=2801339 RepID=A0ABS1JDR4_9BACL|nr:MBL fold metallo-hydrolase [Tumebacillus amylolyticus]MBL0388434.1 MBL fold metallo-hydrolase [Tumebacillus amylolyticus]
MTNAELLTSSKHFTLERLAEGVYAAIDTNGYGAFSNGGFVDLGDRTLVFDSFQTPQAAQYLRTAAELLTGKPVTLLVNSHRHGDHVRGNQVFCDATIISTKLTRDLIEQDRARVEQQRSGIDGYVASLPAKVEAAQTEDERRNLELHLSQMREICETIHTLELTLPTVTFTERVDFHGTKRRAELHCFGGGHSPSDSFLYLPDEKIAFMGDLIFTNGHLAIWEDAREWHRILTRVQNEFDLEVLVPGHGPVAGMQDLAFNLRYLEVFLQTIEAGKAQRLQAEELLELPIPDEFASLGYATIWRGNLRVQLAK